MNTFDFCVIDIKANWIKKNCLYSEQKIPIKIFKLCVELIEKHGTN